MIICKICDQVCKSIRGLSFHLKSHNMSSKKYYDLFFLKKYENYCNNPRCIHKYENRPNYAIFKNLGEGYSIFCSRECQDDNLIGKPSWNSGKTGIYSKNTLKKMSDARKGVVPWNAGKTDAFSEETIERIRQNKMGHKTGMTGKRHTTDSKIKMSLGNKGKIPWIAGKHHTSETIEKIRIKVSGPNSPCWKGGISKGEYCDVWVDQEYKDEIKKWDNYECQNPYCRKISERLCIHHINYNKLDCHFSNLITVCISCNARANFHRKYWRRLYTRIRKFGFNPRLMFE